jgi:hypothetical protein
LPNRDLVLLLQQKNESFNKKRYGSNKQDPDGDIQSRSTIHRLYRTLLYALFRSPLHLHPQQQEQYSIRHSIIRKSKKTPFYDRNLLQLQHFDKISLQNAPNKNMSARRDLGKSEFARRKVEVSSDEGLTLLGGKSETTKRTLKRQL